MFSGKHQRYMWQADISYAGKTESWEHATQYAQSPYPADVLYVLLYDAAMAALPFDKWCDLFELGPNNPWALQEYQEQCNTRERLRNLFGEDLFNQLGEATTYL